MLRKYQDIEFHLIESKKELNNLIKIIKESTCPYWAIDLETFSPMSKWGKAANALNPFMSEIRLTSLKEDNENLPYVVDHFRFSKEELTKLVQEIHNLHYRVKLIAHNASYEYSLLFTNFNIQFDNIKDSRIACYTTNVSTGWKAGQFRGASLGALAKDYFDIFMDKSLGNSNWEAKTLSLKQLAYSAADTGTPKKNVKCSVTRQPIYSIVISLYKLFEHINTKYLDQLDCFELDQEILPVTTQMELNGLPLDKTLLDKAIKFCEKKVDEATLGLCETLGISVQREPYLKPNNKVGYRIIIPTQVLTLFNNNVKLVKEVNKKANLKLDNLQASTVINQLKALEDGDINQHLEEELDYGITILNLILNYKKYAKMHTEALKFKSNISTITNHIHTGVNVTGSSTSRMSGGGNSKASPGGSINLQAIPTKEVEYRLNDKEIQERLN